jgi:hypothetical protein
MALIQQGYQIGMQELNRAVGAAGQYVAIGAEGLIEATHMSGSGVGQDWSKTIPGRLLMGISGVRPQQQNSAGNTQGQAQGDGSTMQQSQPNVGMQIGNMTVQAQNPNDFHNQMNASTQMAIGAFGSR